MRWVDSIGEICECQVLSAEIQRDESHPIDIRVVNFSYQHPELNIVAKAQFKKQTTSLNKVDNSKIPETYF
jgi:hypothetical protein